MVKKDIKQRIVFIVSLIMLSGTLLGQAKDYVINWPENYKPEEAVFFVHNEIEINASPETVWEILIDAEKWQEWYVGAENVQIINNSNGVLNEESVFRWKTMGLNFSSEIKEFVPNERLSWESRKRSIKGYHAWLIIPTESGSRVITDESQNGWLSFLEKIFQPNKLHGLHDIWLQELKKKAELKQKNLLTDKSIN